MRPVSDYLRNLKQIHRYLFWFVRAIALFRRPREFLRHYVRRTSPDDRTVEMRDGTRIFLTGHPHDVITIFVILARRDYGRINPDGIVVDIGANLGVFALHAARCGARAVFAYEPNRVAFECLERNAQSNGLGNIIKPRRLAVSAIADQDVRFPISPSAYNRIAAEGDKGQFDIVRTTTLTKILASEALGGIDLLKLDCEGAEYDILFHSTPEEIRRVREIRMEYHLGRDSELRAFLQKAGFDITHYRPDSTTNGTIWACRRSSVP